MTTIGTDINYSRVLLSHVFNCKSCGKELLMFGCPDSECEKYYKLTDAWKR
jgi:sulfite reductase alpha subunit-like flavoprotein